VKAFLLAGGRGERLLPLTAKTPKCLAPVAGEPLLGIWLDLLTDSGVTEVLVNVSHHADQVRAFLDRRHDCIAVRMVVEAEPRGNAGTVAAQAAFVADTEAFWIFYADNLTTLRLEPMLAAHRLHRPLVTMGLFHAPDPRVAGIVRLADNGRIVGFEEKPANPTSDLANAGIYLAGPELLGAIPRDAAVVDFGRDVFPSLLGRMRGHVIDDVVMDVGTPRALEAASAFWRSHRSKAARA
jgi:mannose-1-phosphate guanylyltransferase